MTPAIVWQVSYTYVFADHVHSHVAPITIGRDSWWMEMRPDFQYECEMNLIAGNTRFLTTAWAVRRGDYCLDYW